MVIDMRQMLLILTLLSLLAASCSRKQSGRESMVYVGDEAPQTLLGVTFVKVPASVFTFNEAPSGYPIEGSAGMFEVAEPEFWISSEPVAVSVLERYMRGGVLPKSGLCRDDMEGILDRIYQHTFLPVVLPSEAMFEAAVHCGAIRPGQGTECVLSDYWVDEGGKSGDEVVVSHRVGKGKGALVVLRSLYARSAIERFRRRQANAFYVALRTGKNVPSEILEKMDFRRKGAPEQLADGKKFSVEVNGALFELMPVSGGSLTLGATEEQERYAEEDERPAREVTLPSFLMGRTEVTCGQWKAVMGTVPSGNYPYNAGFPVFNVNWYDCMEFVLRLRELSGLPFRLPSEEEWEYAARGGRKAHGYIFAGSNTASDVAVCTERSVKGRHKGDILRPPVVSVASRRPNELGLYDMSGSAWEWVRGEHPDGKAILRGGSRYSTNVACRVSNRQPMGPMSKKDSFGLRVAL